MKYRKADQQPIEMDWAMADGVAIKWTKVAKRGDILPQHAHDYDHTTFIATGSVKWTSEGGAQRLYYAPAAFTVEAHVKHMAEILEDGTTILCIHNVSRTGQIEVEAEHELVGAS